MNAYRVAQDYLTVDNTTDQTADVLEDDLSFHSILGLVLDILSSP
jgi:hypothetical protein